ncbi:hypothetical protein AK830_g6624 [Neonectria ditissima]|uniref:Uncharacterized protein n=1 Tax=Neonectria ditissima TaxID=78410 RepID=A0A0P7BHM9_9HYPO|nr:hypothetical protein AK830_g6624 [Neonectria ditissima]
MTAEVSHGRGGAGNMAADDTKYVDGEVVRAGAEGSHGDGAFSSGRGGAGNIGDVGTKSSERLDKDIIPEAAVRPSQDGRDFHTGRGGAGNNHKDETKAEGKKSLEKKPDDKHIPVAPKSLADKLKAKLFGLKK